MGGDRSLLSCLTRQSVSFNTNKRYLNYCNACMNNLVYDSKVSIHIKMITVLPLIGPLLLLIKLLFLFTVTIV